MKRLAKSEIKRQALVEATIKLVNSNGFHATPMAKIAKMAQVSPATIYLYFKNKQDLVNHVYLEVKKDFTAHAFKTYSPALSVEDGFKTVWHRIADFKLNQCDKALFLAQCDNTPVIDETSRQEGIRHLQPLLDLWQRGKDEGLIKPLSDYLLYAYTVKPLSFLMIMQQRGAFEIKKRHLKDAYQAAWDSIKLDNKQTL